MFAKRILQTGWARKSYGLVSSSLCPLACQLFVLVVVSAHAADEVGLEQIITRGVATARLIDTLEYRSRVTYSDGRVSDVRVSRSGDKFLFDKVDVELGKYPRFDITYAFDGHQYQRLMKKEDALLLESKFIGSIGFDPLVRPYYWLLQGPGESRNIQRLRNRETWIDRLGDAKIIHSDEEKINGIACVVMEIPPQSRDKPWLYRVYLAPEHGYYPLRYERIMRESNEVTSRCDVTLVHPFDVDGRKGVFPLVIEYEEKGFDGLSAIQRVKMVIEPVTLKINGPIDDEVFKVSPRRARHVVDVDQANQSVREAMASREIPVRDSQGGNPWVLRLSLGLAVVLVTAIAYSMWRRHVS
jgi:hypothetical protein